MLIRFDRTSETDKRLKFSHILLLHGYKTERNKTQAQKAIAYCMGIELSTGKTVLPYTQNLLDWGLITRTNPGAPASAGHRHVITDKGREVLERYLESLQAIPLEQPQYGF